MMSYLIRPLSSFCIIWILLADVPHIALSFQPELYTHPLQVVGCFSTPSSDERSDDTQDEVRRRPKRRSRKKRLLQILEEKDYQRRREQWLERYGSLQALQSTFGAGPVWGDLSPEQTRRLYHTLLPRSLLGLYEMGLMQPSELAPLAYEARIAAKEYARSRCIWTGRLVTTAFDQYRKLKSFNNSRGGSSSSSSSAAAAASISWESIWQKYEAQIEEEEKHANEKGGDEEVIRHRSGRKEQDGANDDRLTMRIYLRILERSVETNRAFDRLFLKNLNDDPAESDQLAEISAQLETDVRELLLHPKESEKIMKKEERARKKERKAREKEEKKQQKLERRKAEGKS